MSELTFEKESFNPTLDKGSKKIKILDEGKTKIVSSFYDDSIDYRNLVQITTKDVLTANDATKKTNIEVASDKTNQTCNVFRYLESKGVKTSFVKQIDDYSFVAKQCTMLPYECVVRRRAYGSLLKRYPNIESGTYFHLPIKEFFHKLAIIPPVGAHENLYAVMPDYRLMEEERARNFFLKDGKWTVDVITDPYIEFNWEEWRKNDSSMTDKTGFKLDLHRPKIPYSTSNKVMVIDSSITPEEYRDIEELMMKVFMLLENAWKKFDIELIDLKIEVGYDYDNGELLVGDVIDNDSWRLWPKGISEDQLDKQSFRDGENLNIVKEKYSQVTKYTEEF